jgi:hypothetical protein
MGVPLRRIARTAGMPHGHLSKVERGEYRRPVTPTIIAAYERVTGVPLAEAVGAVAETDEPPDRGRNGKAWRPGQLSPTRRRSYNAAIITLTIDGHLGMPFGRLVASAGRPLAPVPPSSTDVAQLERFAELVTALDLQYGGGLVAKHAKVLLRWAVPMLDATDMEVLAHRRLHAAVGWLAHRAAWAAFDASAHDAARSLFQLALFAASTAADPDLRAHVVADVAAQHNHLGYHRDALDIIRFVEGDERITPLVRMVIQLVRARAFAALGDREGCFGCIKAAEQHHDQADVHPETHHGWLASLAGLAPLYAGTGHALATLAGHTAAADATADGGSHGVVSASARAGAQQAATRLITAVEDFQSTGNARARTLCLARLAGLRLMTGELDEAAQWTRRALSAAARIDSVRVERAIAAVRGIASRQYPGEPVIRQLIDEIDAATIQHEPDAR